MDLYSVDVQIETNDGTTKNSTKFSLKEATELERIVIVQGIFKVMGFDNQLTSMIDDYAKLGKAYHEFFNTTKSIEDDVVEMKEAISEKVPTELINESIYEKVYSTEPVLASDNTTELKIENANEIHNESLTSKIEDLQKAMTNNVGMADHYKTGIRHSPTGERYQCRLICIQCRTGKTMFIKATEHRVHCKECGKEHSVRKAKNEKMQKDSNNNFFIAGLFVGEDEK